MREDLESYRGALTWLIEHGRSAEASDITWGLFLFWLIRGHAAEGLWWYEQILNRPSLPPVAESRALVGSGDVLRARRTRARTHRAHARSRARPRAGDMEVVAQAENMLGTRRTRRRQCRRGPRPLYPQRREVPGAGDPVGARECVEWDGGGRACDRRPAQAERLLDEATSVLRHAGPWFLSLTRYVRAILAVRRGNADEAIGLVRESLTRIRELHDKFAFVYALVPLAAAAVLKGDDAWAARILGARDAVTERTGGDRRRQIGGDLKEHANSESRARLGRMMGPGVRGGSHELYRCVAEGHRA